MKKIFKVAAMLSIFLVPVATWAFTLDNPLGNVGDPRLIFTRLVGALAVFTGTLALVFFVLGGYRILTAAGNSEHFARGKTMILYSMVGFVVTLSSYYILFQVITVLTGKTNLSGFTSGGATLTDPLGLNIADPTTGATMYGARILGYLLSGLGGLTLLMFVYGGLQWLIAEGNEEKISKAKKTIMYAVLGLAAVLGSYVVLKFVYTPFYNLLAPAQERVTGPLLPGQEEAFNACFKSDGTCVDVNINGCTQLSGQYYQGVSCGEIGCCEENYNCLIDIRSQSRVSVNACVPTIFAPCYAGTTGGACFSPTLSIDGQCYNPVHLIPGQDCSL